MAASVTRATSSSHPAWAAIISITSPWISVESTSITISRTPRRCSDSRCTARSMPCLTASAASNGRSISAGAPDTYISMAVTG